MGKYLHLWKNKSQHDTYVAGSDYIEPYIGYDTQNVYYNVAYKLLDILYADANGNKKVDSTVLDSSLGYIPIGLCIAGTGFFGKGEKARFMSLKYMSYDTPEAGSLSPQYMHWGNKGTDLSTIDNIQITHNGGQDWGYLTADWITNTNNKIPSLFDANGNWNLTELGTVNQFVTTDIDGKNKTGKILATATAQSDWRTATTITNNDDEGYAPAACCCARYHTLGTQTGDWYLGASGEISMIVVQKTQINTKLAQIATAYADDCVSSLDFNYCWSSTEYDSNNAYYVYTGLGLVSYGGGKVGPNHVISMLQF